MDDSNDTHDQTSLTSSSPALSTTSSRRSTLDSTPSSPPPIPSQIIVTFDGKVREIERFGPNNNIADADDKREGRKRSGSEGSRYYATHDTSSDDMLERMAEFSGS